MDGEAYGCVENGKDACPDSNVAAKVEADRVGSAAESVPRAKEQCGAKKEEAAVCGGHTEAMTEVRRRSGEVEETSAGCGERCQYQVAFDTA
jgi:hypothetical protein